jgi:hypothetical protein
VASSSSSSLVESRWFKALYPTRSAKPITASVVLDSVADAPQSE